ncbi:MAG: GNAT family N-acetyltransferase [Patescibacteria group bacterium]
MPSTKFTNIAIRSDDVKLVSLNKKYSQDVLENNYGNVRDFFIPFNSITEVNSWIEDNLNLMENGDKIELVLLNKMSSFTGMLSIRNIKTDPVFGLWIKPEAQNKGYAKKGMSLFINWLFNNTSMQKLVYSADVNNVASNSLAKSLGMSYTRNFTNSKGSKLNEYILIA